MVLWGEALWGEFVWGGDPDDTSAAILARALAGPTTMRFRLEQRTKRYGFLADITRTVRGGGGVIDCDNFSAGVKRTLSGLVLKANDLPETFPESDAWVAPFCDVWNSTDQQWEELPLGLYQLDNPTEALGDNGEIVWSVAGADPVVELLGDQRQASYLVPAGTDYGTAVAILLQDRGFKTDISPVGLAAPNDIVFPPGTSASQIAERLLDGVNHHQVYFDAVGTGKIKQRVSPFARVPDLTLSTLAAPRMAKRGAVRRRDTARYPNREVVRVNDPKREAFAAYAENNDPGSDISTVRRGTTIVTNRDVPTAVDPETAQDIAVWDLEAAVARSRTLAITTRLDPRRAPHELYEVTLEEYEDATKWLVLGWSLPLLVGPNVRMTHTLGNAQNVALSSGNL